MLHNVSNRKVLTTIVFILCSTTLLSQVNIKERVEIKPSPPLQKMSTESPVLFAVNPDSNQGSHQEGSILVLYPCVITVTGSMEIHPNIYGSYPATDLAMFTIVGGPIAWYKGYPDGTHASGGGSVSYSVSCGRVGAALSNTMGYEEITQVTRTISSSSATIIFEGKLLGWPFTATATLTAVADVGYELASMELTADITQITQCRSNTTLHVKMRNNKGDVYNGIPCQNPPVPVVIGVESSCDIQLSCAFQQGKSIGLPYGDVPVELNWNYRGEVTNNTATVTLAVGTQTKAITFDLVVDTALAGLQFEDVPSSLLHMLKTKVIVRGLGCGGMGSAPLPDGTVIDLEITEGANWGYLRDPETGQQGTRLPSLKTKGGCVTAEYWAQGDNPSVWEAVFLRATSAAASAQCRIDILAAGLKVTLGRSEIGFGDTTKMVVERGNEDDGYTAIPTDWKTMYEIVEAGSRGYFYSPDSSNVGSPLVGQYPEAMFYAKDTSSAPDSLVLLLKVTAVEPYVVVWNVKANDSIKSLQGNTKAKVLAGSGKGMKLSKERLLTDTEEPPNLGPGYYHYGVVQLVVKKEEQLDHFLVLASRDTIAHRDACVFFVIAQGSDNKEVALDSGKIVTFTVDSSQYGSYLLNNSTRLDKGTIQVPYGLARAGEVQYVSDGIDPLFVGPKTLSFQVYLNDDQTKNGVVRITIKGRTIITIRLSKNELKPLGDSDNKKADPTCVSSPKEDTCRRIVDFSKVDTCTLVLSVKDPFGKGIANYPFWIQTGVRDNSGGHDHTLGRPTGRLVTTDKDTLKLFRGKTDTTGKSIFKYLCSGFGGIDSIFVKGKEDNDTSSSAIILRFSGFQELTSGEHYKLIGAHSQGAVSEHEKNHFGTSILVNKLKKLSDTVYSEEARKLRFNDVSLVNGGPFDISNNWNTPHQKHRQGVSVDIDEVDANNDPIDPEYFERIVTSKVFGGVFVNEGNHFHITFR